jgi:hypothetical protein
MTATYTRHQAKIRCRNSNHRTLRCGALDGGIYRACPKCQVESATLPYHFHRDVLGYVVQLHLTTGACEFAD